MTDRSKEADWVRGLPRHPHDAADIVGNMPSVTSVHGVPLRTHAARHNIGGDDQLAFPVYTSFFFSGELSVGSGVSRFPFPVAGTLIDCRTSLDTAPTGSTQIADVHKNGTTIFTTQANRPTIAISAFDSGLAVPDVTVMAAGDYLTVDIDQVGSTIAGSDFVLVMQWRLT